MAKALYGSLQNRLMENGNYNKQIEVGTRLTEYHYTDREVYEVIEVQDQKHVTVRRMTAKAIGEPMSNTWELISDENNPVYNLTKRGAYWYYTSTITAEKYEENKHDVQFLIWCAGHGITPESFSKRNKVTRYRKANVTFGRADYYYDYSF